MISLFRTLKKAGVLSINQRNSDYVLKYNARNKYPLVDDKLKTKQLAIDAGIKVPKLYKVIRSEYQLKNLDTLLANLTDFVIKPAQGAGGDGIIVITGKIFGRYRQINGKLLTTQELSYHLSCILSGAYSLGGHVDCAIIEHRVVADAVFREVSYEGIPDIRVITLLGYPAMAMARLPTRLSQGKANLHQGAIGLGIDLTTGKTLGGVFHNDVIDYHPDTLYPVVDIQIPYWSEILYIAASCYELTGLGYLGVDIVLDNQHGPLMLELNARPGLNIQIANRAGALTRYRRIEHHVQTLKAPATIEKRIDFSRNHLSQA
ncbi:MAG: alpha-L-glutamate ligase-like protein [Legionellaceae bacterium]|nr:alpha-L-glutamate ligase-like protein [Legionellaceae bacterium]HAF87556.1 alpha-L-glutamate ligase-like protein [Legionellales bacterium]HCA89964.1 alpha-L-glutamate ligase-like protein [Legionellales bacterium]|tara:strand:- start:3334 stop:4287 length:954 start_codon:yes stop_codon:yes gene_type:complete